MRELRTRIAQRHGIDLSQQQLQELAARRLEAVLDPRSVKPALLEELRRNAAAGAAGDAAQGTPGYDFTEATLYESHRGVIRFFRRILNPLVMLFINPTPIARALSAQSRINTEAAARTAEQAQRQSEWNALHFDILQRLVTEVARVSLEVQALSTRVESLVARVDFNDKRVRSLENLPAPSGRQVSRPAEAAVAPVPHATPAADGGGETAADGTRRKRRRRRGRRPGGPWPEGTAAGATATASGDDADRADDDETAVDEGPEMDDGSAGQSQAAHHATRESTPVSASAPTPEPSEARDREGDAPMAPGEPSTLDR